MPLFADKRDISLFRHINRELINGIINIEVDLYKLSIPDSESDLYGESLNKNYGNPIRIFCLISVDEQSADYTEFGPDVTQTARFAFLRDDLVLTDVVIDVGDIINWNSQYWELDKEVENQYFMRKNPLTNKTISSDFGWNVSIVFAGHLTRKNKVQIEDMDGGVND